jgi:hypothetical protein
LSRDKLSRYDESPTWYSQLHRVNLPRFPREGVCRSSPFTVLTEAAHQQPFLFGATVFGTIAAQIKSLQESPPRQGADKLSMQKVIEGAVQKLDNPNSSSN